LFKINHMKLFFLFLSFFSFNLLFSQSNLSIDKKQIYLGEIDINNIVTIDFNCQNKSDNELILSYEPITNLVNSTFPKPILKANEKGIIKVNFYPESEGPFNEKLWIRTSAKDEIELTIYGSVTTISKSYKSLSENNKLFGDRDIAFMIVDGLTRKGIPNSKIFIRNAENNKCYIGISDNYGVLINRIPEGKYKIQALINGYKHESLDIKLDPDRNIAMILLERDELKDTIKKPIPKVVNDSIKPKQIDTIAKIDTIIAVKKIPEPIADIVVSEIITPPLEIIPEPVIKKTEPRVVADGRKPLNIILLLDVSKSMEKPNRIGILKKSIVHLVENYEANDHLTILTFNDKVSTIMERNIINDKKAVIQTINSILPSGTTDGVLGIDRAFEILQNNFMTDAVNMVILASDGKISANSYEDKKIYEKVELMNENGLLTSVIGFGTSSYDQSKLSKIASIGGGLYLNLNVDSENMEKLLFEEIYGTLLKLK
jgi:uncharacterized protein YegL